VLRRYWRQVDYILVATVVLLTCYSCMAIYAATFGKADPKIPSHAWMKQLVFGIIGFCLMWAVAIYDYRSLRKVYWWIYAGSCILLVAVWKFPAVNGAHSWISLPGISFQPSEFAKIAMIIALAGLMTEVDESEFPDYRLVKTWPMWLTMAVPFALTLKEPALGQALVMFAIFCTMYILYVRRTWFVIMVVLFVGFCVVFIALPMQFPIEATNLVENVLVKHFHLLHGYQADRILAWLDTSYQPLGAGYNVRQAQTAIGSGQLFGEGWLGGLETSSGGVPNQWTDYIFSAIGEEFGFIGSSTLVFLFLVLVYRLVRAANLAQDTFGTYIAMGVVAMFGFQVFENIGMDMYMSPSTGITLPFISYGGSSVVVNYLAVGFVLGVALRRKRLRFS